jgi:hypothetical protein
VTDFGNDLERLRARYLESLRDSTPSTGDVPDAELIWDAVSGALPPEERRRIVDRVAMEPAWAEAWRLASEIHGAVASERASSGFWQSHRYLAAAASVAILVGAGIIAREVLAPEPVYRDPGRVAIESLVPENETVPREELVLRWSAVETGARYDVMVTTESLQVVSQARDLGEPEHRVPAERLSEIPSGGKLYWQVTARLPGGAEDRSRTFVVTIR